LSDKSIAQPNVHELKVATFLAVVEVSGIVDLNWHFKSEPLKKIAQRLYVTFADI